MMKTGLGVAVMGLLVVAGLLSGLGSWAEVDPSSIAAPTPPARRVLASLDADASSSAAMQLSAGDRGAADDVELAGAEDADGAWSKKASPPGSPACSVSCR